MAFETSDAVLSGTTELQAQNEEGVELQPQGENVPTTMQPRLKILRPLLEQESDEEEDIQQPEKPLTRVEQIRKQLQRDPDGKMKVLGLSQRKRLQQELARLEKQNRNSVQVPPSLPQAQHTIALAFVPTPGLNESITSQSTETSEEEEELESSESEKNNFNNDIHEMFGKPTERNNDFDEMFTENNDEMFGKPRESNNYFDEIFSKPTNHEPSTSPISEKPGEDDLNKPIASDADATFESKIDPIAQESGSICTYTYKKNSKYHRKGDPCENTVAKHPKVGGENRCSSHQPKDADYPEDICEHKRYKGWKEMKCPNRVSNDGTPDGERFCGRCIADRQAQAEKLNRKPAQKRGKCPNILKKGIRQGKVCNNPLPKKNRDLHGVCTSCGRSKRDKNKTTADDNDEQHDMEARREELDDVIRSYPRGTLKLANLTTKQTIKKDSKLDKILPEHWRFVVETLACKDTVPSDMAQVLFWRAHRRFRYNSLRDTVYWEKRCIDGNEMDDDDYDDDDEGNEENEEFVWEEIPTKKLSRIQHVKDQVFRDVHAVLEEVEHIFNNNALDSQLNRIRNLLSKSAAKPLTSETFELFLDMLYQSRPQSSNKAFRKLLQQKKSPTLNFVKAFVEACIKRSDGPQERYVTTSDILAEYDKWRKQQQQDTDAPEMNTVSLGIALAKINQGNCLWSYGGSKSNRYHHIEFQTNQ